ncbi:MAG: hypothetical protein EB059_10700 [Alphaproteobacteria bacterium]|nr:hypothetical protein [Alphaproteobacteria bacterium]
MPTKQFLTLAEFNNLSLDDERAFLLKENAVYHFIMDAADKTDRAKAVITLIEVLKDEKVKATILCGEGAVLSLASNGQSQAVIDLIQRFDSKEWQFVILGQDLAISSLAANGQGEAVIELMESWGNEEWQYRALSAIRAPIGLQENGHTLETIRIVGTWDEQHRIDWSVHEKGLFAAACTEICAALGVGAPYQPGIDESMSRKGDDTAISGSSLAFLLGIKNADDRIVRIQHVDRGLLFARACREIADTLRTPIPPQYDAFVVSRLLFEPAPMV